MKSILNLSFLIFCGMLFSACDRMSLDTHSSITLNIPKNLASLQKSESTQSQSNYVLNHLAIQITGPGIDPIVKIYDGDKDKTALQTTSFSFDVTSGNDRVVQILAAYAVDGSDESSTIYYGDTTKTLNGGEVPVEVSLSALAMGGGVEQAHIRARYLDSNTTGPTGTLRMYYRPAGKPSMIVDEQAMVGGWFEAVLFKTIAVDYKLPDGSFLFEQATIDSLKPSASLVRMAIPASDRREWYGNSNKWSASQAQSRVLGFFAKNANFLSDKKVCVDLLSLSSEGTRVLYNYYYNKNNLKPVPLKYYESGTTPTISANYASLIGGKPLSSCNVNSTDEFRTYLRLNSMGLEISGDLEDLAGLSGLWASQTVTDTTGTPYRSTWVQANDANGPYASLQVLPGVESQIKSVQLYTQSNPAGTNYNQRCNSVELSKNNWLLKKTLNASTSTGQLKLMASDLQDVATSASSSLGVCLLDGGGNPVGNLTYLPAVSFSPASQLTAQIPYEVTPYVNQCVPFIVSLNSMTAGLAFNPQANATVTVNIVDSSTNPVSMLYANADCSDTPQATRNYAFAPYAVSLKGYFRGTGAENYSLRIPSNSLGIAVPNPLSIYFVSGAPASQMELRVSTTNGVTGPIAGNFYANTCTPLRLVTINPYRTPVASTGSVTLEFKYADGTAYALPAGMQLMSSCSSSATPVSPTFAFANEVSKEFALVVGDTPATNLNIQLTTSNLGTPLLNFNSAPVVDHLSLSVGGNPMTAPQFSCLPVNIQAKNSNDALTPIPAHEKLTFNLMSIFVNQQAPQVATYIDSQCVTPVSSIEMLAGENIKNIFFKPMQPGVLNLSYYSANTSNQTSTAAMTITPGPLTLLTNGTTSIYKSMTVNFTVTGGTPPYTITKTGNMTFTTGYSGSSDALLTILAGSTAGSFTLNITDSLGQNLQQTFTVY